MRERERERETYLRTMAASSCVADAETLEVELVEIRYIYEEGE